MAGYNRRLHMSNNAVDAYELGTKPYDEWSRAEILCEVKKLFNSGQFEYSISFEDLESLSLKALKMCTLSFSSWHHTTRRYKETDFYFGDNKKLLGLTKTTIRQTEYYVKTQD